MELVNDKIQLTSKEILNRYFWSYRPQWDVILTKHDQINVDSSIAAVDSTEVINRYFPYINMFLGANCSNSNNLDFDAVKKLFLSGIQYSPNNLRKLNIGFDFDKAPNIDLSNNDFGKYNYVWDFSEFLFQIRRNVYSYVYPAFSHDYDEAFAADELEFNTCGVFYGYATDEVLDKIKEVTSPIIKKLIPNIKNTNMQILINLKDVEIADGYELLEDILKSGFFDGCYIKSVNCPDFSQKMGFSENDFELYQYSQNIYLKKRKSIQ